VSGQLHPRGNSPWYQLDSRLGGPQSRPMRHGEEKVLDPAGTRTQTPRSSSPYRLRYRKSKYEKFKQVAVEVHLRLHINCFLYVTTATRIIVSFPHILHTNSHKALLPFARCWIWMYALDSRELDVTTDRRTGRLTIMWIWCISNAIHCLTGNSVIYGLTCPPFIFFYFEKNKCIYKKGP
jgi:hypothetical protein